MEDVWGDCGVSDPVAPGDTFRWTADTELNGVPGTPTVLTLTVTDPSGNTVAGFPIALGGFGTTGTGQYYYDWVAPGVEGLYSAVWAGTLNGLPILGTDEVYVLGVGGLVLIWAPPVGSPITLATVALDYNLATLDGIGPVASTPLTSKSPGQPGTTALDAIVPSRLVIAQGEILGTDLADLWALRAALASAMAQEPVAAGASLALGLLTLMRGALPDLEIPAMPNSSSIPFPQTGGYGYVPFDLEWLCPYPFWRATVDTTVTISAASTPTAVANPGDALCPPLIQIYGDLTLVTVTNLTTGESFQLAGQIPAGQYVEVITIPGAKAVNLVNGSVRTGWMDHLNISQDQLFSLAPGANSIEFTAGATGGSGARQVVFTFRPRTRGV